jgi:hypothetical protein
MGWPPDRPTLNVRSLTAAAWRAIRRFFIRLMYNNIQALRKDWMGFKSGRKAFYQGAVYGV